MVTSKFVDFFEINNFVSKHFNHFLYILAEKLNFLFLQKRFSFLPVLNWLPDQAQAWFCVSCLDTARQALTMT